MKNKKEFYEEVAPLLCPSLAARSAEHDDKLTKARSIVAELIFDRVFATNGRGVDEVDYELDMTAFTAWLRLPPHRKIVAAIGESFSEMTARIHELEESKAHADAHAGLVSKDREKLEKEKRRAVRELDKLREAQAVGLHQEDLEGLVENLLRERDALRMLLMASWEEETK